MFASIVLWLRTVFAPHQIVENPHMPTRQYRDETDEHTTTALNLGTDDRESFSETPDSREVARTLLEEAQTKAETVASNETVTVTLKEDHRNVHHMELMLSLIMMAKEYGLQAGPQFNNRHSFIKLPPK